MRKNYFNFRPTSPRLTRYLGLKHVCILVTHDNESYLETTYGREISKTRDKRNDSPRQTFATYIDGILRQ